MRIHGKNTIYVPPFLPIHTTKPSFFFNLRSGRPPRLQVCPLRAHQRRAPLPVSESSGEPRLHEGGPEGEGAAVGGAKTPAPIGGALTPTGVLKSKKKWQETLAVRQVLLLSLSGLDLLLLRLWSFGSRSKWSDRASVPLCSKSSPASRTIPHSDLASSAELLYLSKQHLYYSKRTS